MELIISFVIGAFSSAVVGYFFYRKQKKTDDVLISAAELQEKTSEIIQETQLLHSMRTALLRNQQDLQTKMLKMGDHLSHHIKEQVEDLLLEAKHPEFFSSTDVIDLTPKEVEVNSDIPRIGHLLVASSTIKPGSGVRVIFRVNDDEWNFAVPSGATVSHYGEKFTPALTSAKYMYFEINIPAQFSGTAYNLDFFLKDRDGHENQQRVSIPVNV